MSTPITHPQLLTMQLFLQWKSEIKILIEGLENDKGKKKTPFWGHFSLVYYPSK